MILSNYLCIYESFSSLVSYPLSQALLRQFLILIALVLESTFIQDRRDALVNDHREVDCDESKDDNDAGPATEVPRLRIMHKLREHDQVVSANDDQDFVDKLKSIRHAQNKRLEVADVDHDKTALEDH